MKNKELLLEAINNTIVELEKAYTQEELCHAYADQAGYQYKHSEAVGNCMHQAEKLMKEEMDLAIKEGKFKIKDA